MNNYLHGLDVIKVYYWTSSHLSSLLHMDCKHANNSLIDAYTTDYQ